MANSMDSILVKYLDKNQNIQTVTVPEFIKISPRQLNDAAKSIQKAIKQLYDLNGKQPPLYKGFPDWHRNKLSINCVDILGQPAGAQFYYPENEVRFFENSVIHHPDGLLGTIAHELKHAEQYAQKEVRDIILYGSDNRAKQEIFLMDEAEAFFTALHACIITNTPYGHGEQDIEKYKKVLAQYNVTNLSPTEKMKHLKTQMMKYFISGFATKTTYASQREMKYPLTSESKGISHIPKHYGLTDAFVNVLNSEIPREPQTRIGKLYSLFKAGRKSQIGPAIEQMIKEQNTEQPDIDVKCDILWNALNRFNSVPKPFKEYLFSVLDSAGNPMFGKQIITIVLGRSSTTGKNKFITDINFLHGTKDYFDMPILEEQYMNDLVIEMISNECGKKQDPKNIEVMFNSIKDKNGNMHFTYQELEKSLTLPKSGRTLHGNIIFSKMYKKLIEKQKNSDYNENEYAEYYSKIIPILASIKDANELPIITDFDILNIPTGNILSVVARKYLKTMHLKEATKKIENTKNNTTNTKSKIIRVTLGKSND